MALRNKSNIVKLLGWDVFTGEKWPRRILNSELELSRQHLEGGVRVMGICSFEDHKKVELPGCHIIIKTQNYKHFV